MIFFYFFNIIFKVRAKQDEDPNKKQHEVEDSIFSEVESILLPRKL